MPNVTGYSCMAHTCAFDPPSHGTEQCGNDLCYPKVPFTALCSAGTFRRDSRDVALAAGQAAVDVQAAAVAAQRGDRRGQAALRWLPALRELRDRHRPQGLQGQLLLQVLRLGARTKFWPQALAGRES